MKKIINKYVLVSLFILSASSVLYAATLQNSAAGFPNRHSDFDYKIAWKTAQVKKDVLIEGVMKNTRYANIDGIELTIFLVGKDGKTLARATALPFPQQSRADEVVSFSTKLHKVALKSGDTLKFIIQYTGSDGGGGGADGNSGFAVDAMTGASLHKENVKPDEW